jgi:hypothetical protein
MADEFLRELHLLVSGACEAARDAHAIFRDDWGDIYVDTCFVLDGGCFETYISRPAGSQVVQRYPDENAARTGHGQWVMAMRINPDMELPDLGPTWLPEAMRE